MEMKEGQKIMQAEIERERLLNQNMQQVIENQDQELKQNVSAYV